jgi:hypothetical protein
MKNRDLQNENLDRIGRRLLETARVPDEEIERIAASPQLFEAVKARIKTEQIQKQSRNFFGDWLDLQVWSWQKLGAATAAFAIAAFCIAGLFVFSASRKVIEQVAAPEFQSPDATLESARELHFSEKPPEIVNQKKPGVAPQVFAKQANFKNDKVKTRKPARRKSPAKTVPDAQIQPGGEFYALDFVGSPNETAADLRIVRTEISRSALFALGVNLPIENESEKIKTDLLVGTDGVARAIRFVE